MPSFRRKRASDEERGMFTRTNGDLLVNDLGPSGSPMVSWIGFDSASGAIGPNGPWSTGSASALPVVTRATKLITSPLTAAAFKVNDSATGGREVTAPRWITDPMLLRPDDRFGAQIHPAVNRLGRGKFWAEWIRSAVWFGWGAFLAAEDATGAPVAGSLKLINPLLLSTVRDADGALRWLVGSNPSDGVVFDRDGRITIGSTRYRLVVLRNPLSPVDNEGRSLGVFELHPTTFKLGAQIDAYTSGTFRSGIPAGYLKANQPHLSQKAATDLKEGWLKNHGGDARSIAVLNATTEFVPLAISPVDAELADVKILQIADAAFAFGIDPMTLGAAMSGSSTYSNLRDAWSNHRDFGLADWITAVQDVLTSLLPASQAVAVDLAGFANPTEAEQNASDKVAIDAGIYTGDEVRARRGLPPLPPKVDPPAPPPEDELEEPAARRLQLAQEVPNA